MKYLILRITMGLAVFGLTLIATFAVTTSLPNAPGDGNVAHASESVVIDVGSDWFCSATFENGVCETTIQTGDTVQWSFIEGVHNTTECGDNWSKGGSCGGFAWGSEVAVIPPSTFSRAFDTPGAVYYRCTLHPDSMKGIITVESLSEPTPAPTVEPTPTATAAPTPTPAPSPTAPPPSPTTTPSPTPTPTATPSTTPTPGVDPTDTGAPLSPTLTATPSATPTPGVDPTDTGAPPAAGAPSPTPPDAPTPADTPAPTAAPTTPAHPEPTPSAAPTEPNSATASPSALGAKGLPHGGGWPGVTGGFDVVGLLIAINLPLAALSFAAFRWCLRRWPAT